MKLRQSFASPRRSAQPRSTSSMARRLRPSTATRHLAFPNRRNRLRLCGLSCLPLLKHRLRRRSAPSRSTLCSRAARTRGSRFRWRKPWRNQARDAICKPQVSPRRTCAWRRLPATDPLSERARSALDGGVDIALEAGLPGLLLQRLVTALDALGEEVPIPLWDLAAKTPQPDDGYLPPTGLLSTLKEVADAGDTGRTILLAAAVFGPDGPQGAHLIALGDGLRALKRVGLDAEARRLAFEALYAHWPSRGKA